MAKKTSKKKKGTVLILGIVLLEKIPAANRVTTQKQALQRIKRVKKGIKIKKIVGPRNFYHSINLGKPIPFFVIHVKGGGAWIVLGDTGEVLHPDEFYLPEH